MRNTPLVGFFIDKTSKTRYGAKSLWATKHLTITEPPRLTEAIMIGYALEEKVRQLKKDFSAHFRKITFAAFALGMIILLMGGQSQTPYNFLLIFLGFAILLATTFVIYYMAVLRLWYVMACLSKPFSPRRFTQAIKTATRTTGHNYDISLAIWTLEAWAFGAPPIKIDPPWQDAFLRAYLA